VSTPLRPSVGWAIAAFRRSTVEETDRDSQDPPTRRRTRFG
jgi:hypothetical protein